MPASEAWVVCGRRSGKSRIASAIAAYIAALAPTTTLAPGEWGTVLVCAVDKRQAQVIFRYVKALFGLPAYGLDVVQADKFAGRWVVETFARHGVTVVQDAEAKSAVYLACLPLLTGQRCDLLDLNAASTTPAATPAVLLVLVFLAKGEVPPNYGQLPKVSVPQEASRPRGTLGILEAAASRPSERCINRVPGTCTPPARPTRRGSCRRGRSSCRARS
jgi:hypothetical protein